MKGGKFGLVSKAALMVTVLAVVFLGSGEAPAGTNPQPGSPSGSEQIIFSFLHGDGNQPNGLIRDAAGNLYGTSGVGGSGHAGNAFELSPRNGGGWSFTVLHTFGLTSGDGLYPSGALVMDGAGNLYGLTQLGGAGSGCYAKGCGVVFELSLQAADGSWTEKILYSFQGGNADGAAPNGSLVFDSAGNLYGTTLGGVGTPGGGTVFELSPQSEGNWQEAVLYTFADSRNGYEPYAGVIFDAAGNLYGTTAYGGASPCDSNSCGTVFELSPQSGSGWTERVLHTFRNSISNEVNGPVSGVIFDTAGNLYGVTTYGGPIPCNGFAYGCGTVYELSPESGGNWSKRDIHDFAGYPQDGQLPLGVLIFDPAGNLWGVTQNGGSDIHSNGTVFELLPQSGGNWQETIRYDFKSGSRDGHHPDGGLALGPGGNVYGTTYKGGSVNGGTVFEVTP